MNVVNGTTVGLLCEQPAAKGEPAQQAQVSVTVDIEFEHESSPFLDELLWSVSLVFGRVQRFARLRLSSNGLSHYPGQVIPDGGCFRNYASLGSNGQCDGRAKSLDQDIGREGGVLSKESISYQRARLSIYSSFPRLLRPHASAE